MEQNKLNLGWFQKQTIKYALKKLEKLTKEVTDIIREHKEGQEIEIAQAKEKIIRGIIGNKENNEIGFASIFELTNEDGKELTENELRNMTDEELIELNENLIEALKEEIK